MASYAVHTPIQAPADLVEKYRDKLLGGKQVRKVRATYAGMVESVDRAVGQILDTLDELGLTNETLVIFTADNGGLGSVTDNRPLRGAKGWPYEGGLRVPLIVRWPGHVPLGSTSDIPFSSIDLVPTLLDVADLPPTEGHDGLDFLPHWLGDAAPEPRPLFWHYPHYHGSGSTPNSVVRDGPWKLIRWYEDGREELFHLENDPGESTDISGTAPGQAWRLARLLDAHLRESEALLPRRPEPATR
jgi:arylsulfatase A-like enzyme